MNKTFNYFKNFTNQKKLFFLSMIIGFILLFSVVIPSFARYRNRVINTNTSVWNGSIAESYKSGDGTINNPYIISNGSELAYFSTQLSNTDYESKYFVLSNDIILNNGAFTYDDTNGIMYTINDETYYVEGDKYYNNIERTGEVIGTINVFHPLNGFKGHFNGNLYRICGLYITDDIDGEIALFTNFQGDLSNLYVENSLNLGGNITSGIVSSANSASIKNVLYGGYVVGNKEVETITKVNSQDDQTLNFVGASSLNLISDIPYGSEIVSTFISGNYSLDDGATLKINNTSVIDGTFEIDLGDEVFNSISLEILNCVSTCNLNLSNLKYKVNYKYALSSGIVGISNNVTIENSINKSNVYGYSVASGIIGSTKGYTSVNQSYNTGNIYGNMIAGGLIGIDENNDSVISITKSYNSGNIDANMIGSILGVASDSNTINIDRVFNTYDSYCINSIISTTVNVNDSYYTGNYSPINNGSISGNFSSTILNNLKTKTYVLTKLDFNEFIDFSNAELNTNNVWVYEDNILPLLYIDDYYNGVANINVGINYTWQNFSTELKEVVFSSNITFNIEAIDSLRYVKAYYYISKSNVPLNKEDLSDITTWKEYKDVVQITEAGNYVVYVKIIDINNNISYINTDLLVLYKNGSSINITLDDYNWNNINNSPQYVYKNNDFEIKVESSNLYFDIKSIKYYISNKILSSNELNLLDDASWYNYSDSIKIDDIGKYIVYVKVLDSSEYITYANTDYIILDGYNETNISPFVNFDFSSEGTIDITQKSTIKYNFTNLNYSPTINDFTHNLVSNIILPKGTVITLVDNINSNKYQYIVTDNDFIQKDNYYYYAFNKFNSLGTLNTENNKFNENNYYNIDEFDEDYDLILDFYNASIVEDYNDVSIYIGLCDSNNNFIKSTLFNTIKKFNIHSGNNNGNLSINTSYNQQIIYNSNSTNNISFNTSINYNIINNKSIYDTTYEDKILGIATKVVDSNNNIVGREYLRNLKFIFEDNEYYFEEDNIVRINLDSVVSNINKEISIVTMDNTNSTLPEGIYYFEISPYASYDGNYFDELSNSKIRIPLLVSNTRHAAVYGFKVDLNNTSRIINKDASNTELNFNITEDSNFNNPNVKISLYKKNTLTAFNQDYTLIDLNEYITNNFDEGLNNSYLISSTQYNNFTLNLNNNMYDKTGYKFVFDLYDGTKKIETIEKYFVVK